MVVSGNWSTMPEHTSLWRKVPAGKVPPVGILTAAELVAYWSTVCVLGRRGEREGDGTRGSVWLAGWSQLRFSAHAQKIHKRGRMA